MQNHATVTDAEKSYFQGSMRSIATESSVLVSSSKYLNHPKLRDLIAQEMLRRNGADLPSTAYIPDVAEILMQLEDWPRVAELFEAEKKRLPEFRDWLDKRQLANFKKDEVKDCAPGTLGAAIHDFLVNSGYDMEFFYAHIEVVNDITFYLRQTAMTHDIEHIVTGFGTTHGGEVALLNANLHSRNRYFCPELAGFINRIQYYLEAKTIMKAGLHYPEGAVLHTEAAYVGATQGRNWKYPLLIAPWREMVDWQITDIQKELGITPVPAPDAFADSCRLVEDAPHMPMMQAAE